MSQPKSDAPAVALAGGSPASHLLFNALSAACANFPSAFADSGMPASVNEFRKRYAQVLPQFEACRLADAEALQIAQSLVDAVQQQVVWQQDDVEVPLAHHFETPAQPLTLSTHQFAGAPGWQPTVTYQGRRWEHNQLAGLGNEMLQRGLVTPETSASLAWIQNEQLQQGVLDLSDRKIVVLGGGAEMAPTRFWLAAGAKVLWLDVAAPPEDWFNSDDLCGELWWPEAGADLLRQPAEILATIRQFAAESAVDLGLYAYAPGRAREVLLTSVMNLIVDALPDEQVASVTLLVSPTTCVSLSEVDQEDLELRRRQRSGWEGALETLGLLGRGGGSWQSAGQSIARSIVPIQGVSYQTAQYVGKILAAQVWCSRGLRVSANTAAITRTRSLSHPVFAAAFGGAAAFGVETLTPRQSRRLNGLLAVADWLHPDIPQPGRVRIHGGIHTLPYPLEAALRVAAAIGFARSPRLLGGLFKR